MNETLEYYNNNAASFVDGTVNADMEGIREHFMRYLPDGGTILDFGCGSGRDSKAFLEEGYAVDAIDGSRELCRLAEAFLGQSVICCTFQEFASQKVYNGIWCCASLLHLEWQDLVLVVRKLASCLDENGVIYMSFKYGKYQGVRNGRWFTDLDEEGLEMLFHEVGDGLKVKEIMITGDVRDGRQDEQWLNVLVEKGK